MRRRVKGKKVRLQHPRPCSTAPEALAPVLVVGSVGILSALSALSVRNLYLALY